MDQLMLVVLGSCYKSQPPPAPPPKCSLTPTIWLSVGTISSYCDARLSNNLIISCHINEVKDLMPPYCTQKTKTLYFHYTSASQDSKHRKNCECCPGHYLVVDHYSSI